MIATIGHALQKAEKEDSDVNMRNAAYLRVECNIYRPGLGVAL